MKAPTIAELVEAVRERLDEAIERPLGGFEARVVRNVLAIIERELEFGDAVEDRHLSILASYEASDDEALAASIRSGNLDQRAATLRADLLALAEAQLAIDNPRW